MFAGFLLGKWRGRVGGKADATANVVWTGVLSVWLKHHAPSGRGPHLANIGRLKMSQNAKIASRGKNDMLSRTRGPDQLDPLALYLDAMGRYPLLTDVDEVELAKAIEPRTSPGARAGTIRPRNSRARSAAARPTLAETSIPAMRQLPAAGRGVSR